MAKDSEKKRRLEASSDLADELNLWSDIQEDIAAYDEREDLQGLEPGQMEDHFEDMLGDQWRKGARRSK